MEHTGLQPEWGQSQAEIAETTLVISRFRFLMVESRISELHVIILAETQILKVGSRISNLSRFSFSSMQPSQLNFRPMGNVQFLLSQYFKVIHSP